MRWVWLSLIAAVLGTAVAYFYALLAVGAEVPFLLAVGVVLALMWLWLDARVLSAILGAVSAWRTGGRYASPPLGAVLIEMVLIGVLIVVLVTVAAARTAGMASLIALGLGAYAGLVLTTVAALVGIPPAAEESPLLPRSRITAASLLPPGRRRGASLVSVIVCMGVVGMALAMGLRGYYQGSRFVALEAQRTRAAAACQWRLESLRAGGYRALPAVGEHEFTSPTPGDDIAGTLVVEPGPAANCRRLTVRVSWPADERLPAGKVELVTIMSARGVGR